MIISQYKEGYMLELLEQLLGGLIVLVISLFEGATAAAVMLPLFRQTTPRAELITD